MSKRNALSLFHGMGCLNIAFNRIGLEFDIIYTSEIDKFANKVDKGNNPNNINLGSVTEWRTWDIDFASVKVVAGGSPCQGFSSSGNQGGTKAELNGEEFVVSTREMYLDAKENGATFKSQSYLFWEYVLLVDHVKSFNPDVKFFLENVKMKKNNLDMITEALGVEPVFINSALVSAQSRQRWYWANWEFDQPEDKKIYLNHIIDHSINDQLIDVALSTKDDVKSLLVTEKHKNRIETSSDVKKCFTAINPDKAITMTARQYANWKGNYLTVEIKPAAIVGRRINPKTNKRDDNNKDVPPVQCLEVTAGDKSRCLSTVEKDTLISSEEPGRYLDAYNRSDIHYRKLTTLECERLQTVPEGYTDHVSPAQRYKMLGNGWTVDVIAHIFESMPYESNLIIDGDYYEVTNTVKNGIESKRLLAKNVKIK